MVDLVTVAEEMMRFEPEFKEGGFVHTHIKQNKSDPLVAIKSAVDRMTDLYDLEHYQVGQVSEIILNRLV
jgi:cytosine/adenosine deaminase-related metal-dependent hydrolase